MTVWQVALVEDMALASLNCNIKIDELISLTGLDKRMMPHFSEP